MAPGQWPSGYSGSGTDTLTITNATTGPSGDLHGYRQQTRHPSIAIMTPVSTPPVSGDRVFNPTDTNFVGIASAVLTTTRPVLSIYSSPPNVILSWPNNWAVALEAATSLTQPITWTPVSGGGSGFLYWPPASGVLAWAPRPRRSAGRTTQPPSPEAQRDVLPVGPEPVTMIVVCAQSKDTLKGSPPPCHRWRRTDLPH